MITINNQRSNNQQSKINDQKSRLHLVACNRNERSALHALHIARHFMHHFTSFHVAFRIISCHISYISSYITHIAHTSYMSRNSHFANSAHFMHYRIRRVILCVISYHFLMKFHITLIHTI